MINTCYELLADDVHIAQASLDQALGNRPIWNLNTIWIDLDYRNLGIATALMKIICRDADKDQVQLWITVGALDSSIDLDRLQAFYRRFDFVSQSSTNDSYWIREPKHLPKEGG